MADGAAATGAATTGGLLEGELNGNVGSADGVSNEGLEANEKPEDPEPKGADPPREKAATGAEVVEKVGGTEKVKPEEAVVTGAVGAMLKGVMEDGGAEGTGRLGIAVEAKLMLGKAAGAAGTAAGSLAGADAKEPSDRKKVESQNILETATF